MRLFAALPLWVSLAPAFWLGWLPWWYGAPIVVGAAITSTWAEWIGGAA